MPHADDALGVGDRELDGLGRRQGHRLQQQLDGLDLKALTAQWKKTGASFDALAQSPEFKETFVNLNGAITELRHTLARIDTEVMPAPLSSQARMPEP